jgi:predicted transcriptional regulator
MDNQKAIELRQAGYTYQQIGDMCGVSRQRVEQVLKKHGASGRFPKIEIVKPNPEQKLQKKIDRFWSRVDVRGDDECWNWTGKKYPSGYGSCKIGGVCYSHRVAWMFTNGNIPDGLCVCHKCDNPSCCNPNHLWLGTMTENIKDRDEKHRGRGSSDYYLQRRLEIVKMKESGMTQQEISKHFGISRPQVSVILRNTIGKPKIILTNK